MLRDDDEFDPSIDCPVCHRSFQALACLAALNDTVLEYRDPGKQRPWLIKKLKEMGVPVSVEEKAAPRRQQQ